MIKTLAELKRAMVKGSTWGIRYPHNGHWTIRRISMVRSNGVGFESSRTKGGTSWFYFPKACELRFIGKDVEVFWPNGKHVMTYRKV